MKELTTANVSLTCGEPDILLGIGHIGLIELSFHRKFENEFNLFTSRIGPLLSGKGSLSKNTVEASFGSAYLNELNFSIAATMTKEDELEAALNNFINVESTGIADVLNNEISIVMEEFRRTIKFDESAGRYEVQLP